MTQMHMKTMFVGDTPQLVYKNASGDASQVVFSPTNTATPFLRFLRETGGSEQAAVDGSTTPAEFFFTPESGELIQLDHLNILVFDDGNITPDDYGNLPALTNGVTAELYISAIDTTVDMLGGVAPKTTSTWAALAYDHLYNPQGPGTNYALFKWTLGSFSADPPPVAMQFGDRLSIFINDDLSSLSSHTFTLVGQRVSPKIKLGTSETFSPVNSYLVARDGYEVRVPPGTELWAATDPDHGTVPLGVTIYE